MNNPPFSRISDMLDSVSFHLECNYRQCVLVAEAYEKSGMKSLANVYWHKAAVYAEAIFYELQKVMEEKHGITHNDILNISDSKKPIWWQDKEKKP